MCSETRYQVNCNNANLLQEGPFTARIAALNSYIADAQKSVLLEFTGKIITESAGIIIGYPRDQKETADRFPGGH
ncbi:hypothetical protein F5Y16DRAFT_387299 [Xylariaceae sp. FL0255]|nr:hypothetical protein F5Y16DRAFT_387299 [Xylariaceae sp. FL0255]